jgi:hypothetical protein
MSEELAGAADIITGAAIARAVEPDAGEGKSEANSCLNCGAALLGAHCHQCGQKAQVHRTLHAFGHDILHSVLHFDGKIWRTLPMLFWNPGDLTWRYVHGERAKFVSPLALFLFSVFLTFAAFNWLVPDDTSGDPAVTIQTAQQKYQNDRAEILGNIAKLETEKAEARAKLPPDTGRIDKEISRHRANLKILDDSKGEELRQAQIAMQQFDLERAKLETEIAKLEADITEARKADKPTQAMEDQLEGQKMGVRLMETAASTLGKGGEDIEDWRFTDLDFPGADSLNKAVEKAKNNPQLLLYKVQSNAYKFSWALIPISVPFVWLLFFWRRQFKLFDHAVFVTYSLTFVMLLGIVCALLISSPATEPIGGILLAFYPPIHMYRHLHHAYQTTRLGAFLRMCLLSFFAMTALTLFAVLIVALGVT